MGVCIPKHIYCDWYDPKEDGGFLAGNEPCVLQSVTEARARSTIGNVRFRALDFGAFANTILIDMIVYDTYDGFPGFQTPNFIQDPLGSPGGVGDMEEIIELKVTFGSQITYYYAHQYSGSPATGVTNLQAVINTDSNRILEIPNVDTGWILTPSIVAATGSGSLIGSTPAIPSDDTYRTGPAYTMVYVTKTEDATGAVVDATGTIKFWNGGFWKDFDSSGSDCVDTAGSPLPTCELEPT